MSMLSDWPSVYTPMSDSKPGTSSAAAAPPNGASRVMRRDVAAPLATTDLTDLVRIFTLSNPLTAAMPRATPHVTATLPEIEEIQQPFSAFSARGRRGLSRHSASSSRLPVSPAVTGDTDDRDIS